MIRLISEHDFEALIVLAISSGLFEPDQVDTLAGMLRSRDENDTWFTDEDDASLVTVAYLAPEKMTKGTWNLYLIAVHGDHQRQGRGTAMLNHVERWLTNKQERILLVETAGVDEFDYVRSFYAKAGFEVEARIRDFYEAGVDKVVFRKALSSRA